MTTWRESAAPIIAETIRRVGKGDMKSLRRELRAAYPFGQRANHPYKIWCSEVRYQLYGRPAKPPKENPDTKTVDMFQAGEC